MLTNPDMLHTGILPHHTKWIRLFENLRYIVLDELHIRTALQNLLRLTIFHVENKAARQLPGRLALSSAMGEDP